MGQTLKVAPAAEPLTLDEVKFQCKIDIADYDMQLYDLIASVREFAEHLIGRAFITQQWEYTLDSFKDRIELPMPTLQSVQSVKYLDENGVLQTLASSEYQVITSELVGAIVPAYGKTWPVCRIQPDSVVVAFTAGYGNASAVPKGIKSWMKIRIATMCEFTSEVAIIPRGKIEKLEFVDSLLDPYRVSFF